MTTNQSIENILISESDLQFKVDNTAVLGDDYIKKSTQDQTSKVIPTNHTKNHKKGTELKDSPNTPNRDQDSIVYEPSDIKKDSSKVEKVNVNPPEKWNLMEQAHQKIKKLYPHWQPQQSYKLELRKVKLAKFDENMHQGLMVSVDADALQILFHRNDFKNKVFLINLMIKTQIEVTVVVVQDYIRQPRLLYIGKDYLREAKDAFEKIHITKAKSLEFKTD